MILNFNRYHYASLVAVALLAAGSWLGLAAEPNNKEDTPPQVDPAKLQAQALELMSRHCISCHGPEKQKGKVRFDDLETIDTVDLQALFAEAQDAVHFEEMPPEEAKTQPTDEERAILLAWFKDQLGGEAAAKLEEKMRRPESGNYVDHEELFSGRHADLPGYTEDRRWMISEHIFEEKFNRIFKRKGRLKIDGKHQTAYGDSKLQFLNPRVNLTNPFQLSNHAGIRYYANETLNGGHLLTMMANSREATFNMLTSAKKGDSYGPAAHEIMSAEEQKRTTFVKRQQFLDDHIEHILIEVFGDQHEKMLPKFARVEVAKTSAAGGEVKKAGIASATLASEEMKRMYLSMQRHEKPGMSDAQLIEVCEREWFHRGDSERDIKARVNFLTNYMEDFRQFWIRYNYKDKYREIEYKPLPDEEMQVVTQTLKRNRKAGDTLQEVIDKCVAEWELEYDQWLKTQDLPSDKLIANLVDQLFVLILERSPRGNEAAEYNQLASSYFKSLRRGPAIQKLMQTLMLNTDFVYRSEFGTGEPDEHGRRMMSPRDASYALAYALTDTSPDPALTKAAAEGRLKTREDYEREIRRMLAKRDIYYIIDEAVNSGSPNFTNMPIRELRFFREFFGYDKLLGIFKDNKRFGGNYEAAKERLVSEADMLVEHILESDEDVFNKLLTTDEFYVFHSGNNETMKANSDRLRSIYETFKDKDWKNFTLEDLSKHKEFFSKVKMRGINADHLTGAGANKNILAAFKDQMANLTNRFEEGQSATAPYQHKPSHGAADGQNRYGGQMRAVEVAKLFNIDLNNWDYPTNQPTKIPKRKGILTHPAWLISFSGNTQTDPIHKGIWIRKKLLADTIPDVPITVDAVIPENHHKTLRQRLDEKTNNNYCMRCHEKINPLGLPFEMYDDFGRYRINEALEHPDNLIKEGPAKPPIEGDSRNTYKTLPVDPRGYLKGTRDKELDGEVSDALDLIDRLAKSDRVRQSMIRHAFRYFMGRNETLNDSKTLIDADQAYLKSGGSFDELIVSLLTSDSFIYRKPLETKN